MKGIGIAVALVVISSQAGGGEEGPWLACRVQSYRKFQEEAWEHLPTLGVRNVFVNVPEKGDLEGLKEKLMKNGLRAVVVRGNANLAEEGCVDRLVGQFETCQELGARYLFLSAKHEGVSQEVACERLRRAGEEARKRGVTIALETHPDLATNAAVQIETMKRIDHPNVRINFDTGNISYYNEGADPVPELEKVFDYVATVELKDHDRVGRSNQFPVLGKGKLDLAGVLKVLKDRGFRGPITIEVEGAEGENWDEEQTKEAVRESVEFVQRVGFEPVKETKGAGR